jgi:hypothetical protein
MHAYACYISYKYNYIIYIIFYIKVIIKRPRATP